MKSIAKKSVGSKRFCIPSKDMKPIAIELFSGCGGLTKGMRDAGFHVAAAVENDPNAAQTYRWNHEETRLLQEDVRELSATDLLQAVGGGPVSLLAGCAPCQGFCSLTSKYRRDDSRNELLLVMAEMIKGVRPEALMMENVPGVLSRGKPIFEEFVRMISNLGYRPKWRVEQMANYGVPQSRRRLVLLAGLGFEIDFPEPTHTQHPDLESNLCPWVTVKEAIAHMGSPVTLRTAQKNGGPRSYNWHVVRNIQPQVRQRLDEAIPGQTWTRIDESIRPECHRNNYRGFTNTYGRMAWDQVSPTITGGCTTASMGRFGHPNKSRYTISVREAAILQTFPSDYKFVTERMDAACNLIGNAVPPLYGKVIAGKIMSSLKHHSLYEASVA